MSLPSILLSTVFCFSFMANAKTPPANKKLNDQISGFSQRDLCPETLPVDQYMKCLERTGFLPRFVSPELNPSRYIKNKLSGLTKCAVGLPDSAWRECMNGFLSKYPQSASAHECWREVEIDSFEKCLKTFVTTQTTEYQPKKPNAPRAQR